jgi:RNA polymerase sigma factor (sigma-70 family)
MAIASAPPEPLSKGDVLALCKQRLVERHLLQSASGLVRDIARIVWRNVQSGRAGRVIARDAGSDAVPPDAWSQYVDKVITIYLEEHPRVARLIDRDDAEWARLYATLEYHARLRLHTQSATRSHLAQEAADFAQQACESIFRSEFPYDVAFAAWANVVLLNHIRRRLARSPDVIDRHPRLVSLDQPAGDELDTDSPAHETFPDPAGDVDFERVELRLALLAAIDQLGSRAQRAVVIDSYLRELSDDAIARKLGKSRQAVYNLRHRALEHLHEILTAVELQDGTGQVHYLDRSRSAREA